MYNLIEVCHEHFTDANAIIDALTTSIHYADLNIASLTRKFELITYGDDEATTIHLLSLSNIVQLAAISVWATDKR